jgi:hypothetical protein
LDRDVEKIGKTKDTSGPCRSGREKECPATPGVIGNPVYTATGNMRYTEREPLPGGAGSFLRAYDSDDGGNGFFGVGWKSPLDERSIKWSYDGSIFFIIYRTNAEPLIIEHREDGTKHVLWPEQGVLPPRVTENAAAGTHTHGLSDERRRAAGSARCRNRPPAVNELVQRSSHPYRRLVGTFRNHDRDEHRAETDHVDERRRHRADVQLRVRRRQQSDRREYRLADVPNVQLRRWTDR